MKKYLLGLLCLVSIQSFAQVDPYAFLIKQYDNTGLNQLTFALAPPAGDGFLFYKISDNTISWSVMTSVSMASSQITDSSSIGRAVMTASTQANARSAIGAGTSNFSGAYSDLTGRPTNLSQFTNDSSFITAATAPVISVNTKTGALTLNASDVGAAATSHTHTASQISDSTTIGRQLLTATNQASAQSIVGVPAAQVNSDWNSVSGVSQILNKPAKYSGATNGSGVYAVTYGSAYSVKPHIVFSVEGGTNKDTSVLTSTTTTGFSILVERRTDIAGLLPTYAAVSGITVNVTVTSN